ncbi:MAG: ATPase [Betaproteobacteria bacterium RIFCSPLOWO2_12_FULL_68_20]|nr:MAG: ATPase [Betaproteobacteria bacterium RIFCSPLOWO2_12_FULL_68_20]
MPAVALTGPRQCGKTTLARALAQRLKPAPVYLDLEREPDRAALADPELYLREHAGRLVVLDEIQRAPELFRTLRGAIDDRRRAGRGAGHFLVLGSASMALLRQSSESLAGRIAHLELTPFLAREAPRRAGERLWVRGGFPGSFLAAGDAASYAWRLDFVQTYLERHIPALAPRVPAETLRRFWTMLAHSQGGLLNAARLAASLGVSGQSVARYLDLLVDLLLVRRLAPWHANAGKRLVKAPKVYVRDSGIVHALLGLRTRDEVLAHPVAGPSWEGYAIENLIASAPAGTQATFYRAATGAEVDLVLELSWGKRWAIEVKRSLAPALTKGFHSGSEQVGAVRRFVVYPGEERYALDRKTAAVPLEELMRELAALAK